jgi:signal transduction histidine kinase
MSARPPYILVVDDTADSAFLLCKLLELSGYHTGVAASGPEALQAIASSPPDMILLDVMLPGMNGYEVTRWLRADSSLPFIPIIMVTSRSTLTDKLAGLESGADDFLTKPINRAELLARVRALLRLKQARDALREEQDAREHMLYLLAHDMRTPLSGVISCLELLDRSASTPDDAELIGMALEACRLQNGMIGDLLDLRRAEAGLLTLDRKIHDLAGLAEALLSPSALKASQKQISLRGELDGPLFSLVDGDKITRVIDNLLRHAIKYTAFGGLITLRVARDPQSATALLSVADSGVPIDADLLPCLFDSYYQPSAARHGARRGVGASLAFCRQIVGMHGGRIWAHSTDTSTSLHVALPLAAAHEVSDERLADFDCRRRPAAAS